MKLQFGKFKGQNFSDTPEWYQSWLIKQDWFKLTTNTEKPLHQQLAGWDGYSRKGQAIEDAIFRRDDAEMDAYDRHFGLDEKYAHI